DVGGGGDAPGALHAEALDRIAALAQPGRIGEHHRDAVEVGARLDDVAGGARLRRDDGAVGADQGVEQARLADVGAADDDDAQPVAQQAPARVGGEQRDDLVAHGGELGGDRGGVHLDVLVAEIDL